MYHYSLTSASLTDFLSHYGMVSFTKQKFLTSVKSFKSPAFGAVSKNITKSKGTQIFSNVFF